jgi:hypothetical protein
MAMKDFYLNSCLRIDRVALARRIMRKIYRTAASLFQYCPRIPLCPAGKAECEVV